MSSLITTPNDKTILQAVQLLQSGQLVCFPTETVYALAADAGSDSAIERVYEAKGRDRAQALAVMVASVKEAQEIAMFDKRAEALAARFFPGPLTLVLPIRENAPLSPLLNQGKQTIAIRIPDHPVALRILQEIGRPVAATSTNKSGCPSAVSVETIDSALYPHLSLILDGGIARLQTGSTIIDLTGETPKMLRQGSISYEEITLTLTA